MSGLTHGRLRQQGPIQWPCPLEEVTASSLQCQTARNSSQEEAQGLFSSLFRQEDEPVEAKRLYAEPIDDKYPFVLTVGRLYEHWHTMTRTGRIDKIIKKQPQPFLEIHPKDAQRLNIEEEEMVEVRSRRGMGRFAARITKAIVPGTVFVPMHWGALWGKDTEANALTHPEACPISLEPELKACAVDLIPVRLDDSMMGEASQSDRAEASHQDRQDAVKQSISV